MIKKVIHYHHRQRNELTNTVYVPTNPILTNLHATDEEPLPPYTAHLNPEGVKGPSLYRTSTFYRITTYDRLHAPTPYGTETVCCIYQADQLGVHSKGQPSKLLGLIKFRNLETQIILSGIAPQLVHTWIPRSRNHRLIVIKLIRSILPELFGFSLPTPVYQLLTKQEYISNQQYHNCSCG
jgi:hypothetical protein